ncbi:hypothetical protein [Methylocucumis oryzae]|uniref:Uncharacterized protein n=1 Tax=Methylocucumis oryzae TaxID=1632867 RepID=A0A0F3IEW4_9GAMM|nr:hypothetical protein [Methylocucumis oryzae]KJV05360.1 hypothetical protein VZ94_18730 [Methylocucumis oryzae]
MVLASDVEYLDQYNPGNRTTASQGDIVVSIDNRSVTIKTDGKTTAQLEQELARELAAKINTTPLIPVIVSKDKRNIKPFDGSEVQLTLVGAEKLTVKVDDPELGVITQFKFKQKEAAAVLPIASGGNDTVLYGLVIAGLAGLGYFFGFRNKKRT